MSLVYCRECGKQISDQAVSCPNCGAMVFSRSGKHKSKSAAILLACLLGGLGMHKFYLNRPGWGLLYLIFCWTFIPVIIGFLEGITYLSMSDFEFQKKYSF